MLGAPMSGYLWTPSHVAFKALYTYCIFIVQQVPKRFNNSEIKFVSPKTFYTWLLTMKKLLLQLLFIIAPTLKAQIWESSLKFLIVNRGVVILLVSKMAGISAF